MRPRDLAPALALALAGTLPACTGTPPAAPPAPPPPSRARTTLLDPVADAGRDPRDNAGTTTLGFGLLRLAPAPGAASSTFRLRFLDRGDGGYSSDATSACLLVIPAEAFGRGDAVYADAWTAFDRQEEPADMDSYGIAAVARFEVARDTLFVVGYGPWDGADVGRPPSDRPSFRLDCEPMDGGTYRWVDSEAGELVTTNWSHRPGARRGGPFADPRTGESLWIETRVLVLYDPLLARAVGPGAPPAHAADPAEDAERLPLPAPLHAVLEKVSIRWR